MSDTHADLYGRDEFVSRHIGPSQEDQAKMLAELVHARVFTRPIRPDERC